MVSEFRYLNKGKVNYRGAPLLGFAKSIQYFNTCCYKHMRRFILFTATWKITISRSSRPVRSIEWPISSPCKLHYIFIFHLITNTFWQKEAKFSLSPTRLNLTDQVEDSIYAITQWRFERNIYITLALWQMVTFSWPRKHLTYFLFSQKAVIHSNQYFWCTGLKYCKPLEKVRCILPQLYTF